VEGDVREYRKTVLDETGQEWTIPKTGGGGNEFNPQERGEKRGQIIEGRKYRICGQGCCRGGFLGSI